MRSVGWILSGLAMLFAGGCASSGPGTATPRASSETVCLSDYEIRSFSSLGNDYLYVEGIRDRHYLFTMQRGCFGLRGAETIGIPDRLGRICSNSADRVVYRDVGRGAAECRIMHIEQVHDRDDARELVKVREEARRNQD